MTAYTIGDGGYFATITAALASGSVVPGDTLALLSGYNTENATVGIENLTFSGDASNTGIALTLSTGIMAITLTGSAPIAVTGNGGNNSITGNDGSNVLIGGEGSDSIDGGAGDDTMIGGGGNDTMISGMLTWQWFYPTQEWPFLVIEGAGDDTMIGGVGDDTYVVSGTGDQVTENPGEGFDTVVALVDYTIGANIESLQLAEGAGNLTGTGNDLDNVLIGNSEPNTLYGMDGDDFLVGGGGFYSGQFYDGYDYGDVLIGGAGNDTYRASTSDVVTENPDEGFDTVQAGMNYTLGANIEKLVLLEGVWAINGTGNDLNNVLVGNSNDNRLTGMSGDDTMIGGAGNDIYLVDSTNDVVTENPDEGNDIVFASVDYTVGPNIESLGRWVSGDAIVIGGAGNDLYLIDSTSALVTENPGEGNDTVYTLVNYTIGPNIENLTLLEGALSFSGTGNDLDNVLVGNSDGNHLNGMGGDDLLDGKGGDDTMIGGAGDDTMIGGAGNDSYYVDSTSDVVTENPDEGTDRVYASADYTIGPNIERLELLEGAGSINGTGNDLDNVLSGNSGANVLAGMGGNDTIGGGGGDDTMIGGAGNDIYWVGSTNTLVIENAGEGFDQVWSSVDYTLGPNIEQLQLYGAARIGTGNDLDNELYGSDADNTLIGGDGNDRLNGGGGGDLMIGGVGNDSYFVDSISDVVFENPGEGNDIVWASLDYVIGPNIESLGLLGGYRNINGTGNDLDNLLVGTSGDNVLDGKGGHDRLAGWGGNDTFVFAAGEADGDSVDNVTNVFAGAYESFRFVGFGTAADGATFTQIGDTNQWQIHSGLDGHNEVITFLNGARVYASNYVFEDAPGNTAPVAAADSYSTNEDNTLNIAAAGVLLNDTDADNDPLTAILVSGVQHGTLTLTANGSFSYTPDANYNGLDRFAYKANDGQADSNVAVVSLTVTPVNDAPVASNDSYTTNKGTMLTGNASAGVLQNDSDIDGDSIFAELVSPTRHGMLTLNPDGSFSYVPAAHYKGTDSFVYHATDSAADSNDATVQINVGAWNPPRPAGTTADMILRGSNTSPDVAGHYEIYNLGNNAILAGSELGQVGTDWRFTGLGRFFGSDTTDMLLRNSSTGAFEVYDIANNNITNAAFLGTVGLNWGVRGFGDFNQDAMTDMLMRNFSTGGFEIYNISNNSIINTAFLGTVGLNWSMSGIGNFSGRGESDILLRDENTGGLEVYDIANNQITNAAFIGTIGLDWRFSGVGNFSGMPGETDLLLRNGNTGGLEVYNINNNQLTGAAFLGTVGLDWQFAGVAPVRGPGTSDLVLRNVNTGAFEVYNITNNQITGAALLGTVGLDWQLGGFAADPPTASTGSSDDSTSQLVEAMAGFDSGAADMTTTILLGAGTSQRGSRTPVTSQEGGIMAGFTLIGDRTLDDTLFGKKGKGPFELVSKIAITSSRDHFDSSILLNNQGEIYLINPDPDRTDPQRLTSNKYMDALPMLSPDGKKIVFDSNRLTFDVFFNPTDPVQLQLRKSTISDLFVMDADGENQVLLTRGSSATWSPESNFIAFHASASYYTSGGTAETQIPTRNVPGSATMDSDIFVANVHALAAVHDVRIKTQLATNITNTPGLIEEDADWSPDGQSIVFTRRVPMDPAGAEIWVMKPDGAEPHQLTRNRYEERGPSWSPDGTRIAFSSFDGHDFEICVMNADGSGFQQLTDNDFGDLTPSWSPDGTQIAFHRTVQSTGDAQMFIMKADGTEQTQVTYPPGLNLLGQWGEVRTRVGDHATGGAADQLVQAMAGFGSGSGTGESLNTAPLGADTSQQTFLTTPHT
jgi:VCBS repeat-containing protein